MSLKNPVLTPRQEVKGSPDGLLLPDAFLADLNSFLLGQVEAFEPEIRSLAKYARKQWSEAQANSDLLCWSGGEPFLQGIPGSRCFCY